MGNTYTVEPFELSNGVFLEDEWQIKILKKLLKINPAYSKVYKWDSQGIADVFADCVENELVYCVEEGKWYLYDGCKWVADSKQAIEFHEKLKLFGRLLQIYCDELTIPDMDEETLEEMKTKYRKLVNKVQERSTRKTIEEDSRGALKISITDFDKDPYLINCINGTYDLRTLQFRGHDYKDYLTMCTSCSYNASYMANKCDRWYEFIDEITCGDKELAEYLQTTLGYSLLGINSEECMFFAYGKTTRNGKGTLFTTLYKTLGDYIQSAPIQLICQTRKEKDPNAPNPTLSSLRSARIVIMSESRNNKEYLDVQEIKNLTGNDTIKTRTLFETTFTFIPPFKMWVQCNYLPDVDDKTLFQSDRVKIIPFSKHFSAEERDTTLKEQFATSEARSVVFNWLLNGYIMYTKNKLSKEPQCVSEYTEAYNAENDSIAQFLEETVVFVEKGKTKTTVLYEKYKLWCRNSLIDVLPKRHFYNELTNRGYLKVKSNGVEYFNDIELKSVATSINTI